jgi:hypothetical protein
LTTTTPGQLRRDNAPTVATKPTNGPTTSAKSELDCNGTLAVGRWLPAVTAVVPVRVRVWPVWPVWLGFASVVAVVVEVRVCRWCCGAGRRSRPAWLRYPVAGAAPQARVRGRWSVVAVSCGAPDSRLPAKQSCRPRPAEVAGWGHRLGAGLRWSACGGRCCRGLPQRSRQRPEP